MLGDIKAELIPVGAGLFAFGERVIHLGADAGAKRGTVFKALVVSACVESGGHQKERLGGDQRDGRTGRVDKCGSLFALHGRSGGRLALRTARGGRILPLRQAAEAQKGRSNGSGKSI